jgi:fructosamine-3-kinase
MTPALAEAIGAALGSQVASARRTPGGDINDAFAIRLGDGRRLFVKTHARAPIGLFPTEARGLDWLREAGALRVPQVVAAADASEGVPAHLVLELIETGPRSPGFDRDLGVGLGLLHRAAAPAFGHVEDNFIGRLPQSNATADSWPVFYAERRLRPLVRDAVDRGLGPRAWTSRIDALAARLPTLLGPPEPPARLHGDLWSGNVIADALGAPVIIDPAVYGGHREIDLAMLQLFGSPDRALFDAYSEIWPLAPGWRERVRLHQLYPLLVHVNLFGGSYVESADAVMRAYS